MDLYLPHIHTEGWVISANLSGTENMLFLPQGQSGTWGEEVLLHVWLLLQKVWWPTEIHTGQLGQQTPKNQIKKKQPKKDQMSSVFTQADPVGTESEKDQNSHQLQMANIPFPEVLASLLFLSVLHY